MFFLMGLFGSSAHYLAVCTIHGERTLARLVGFAYAGGILLQYINNNLINIEIAEAVILSVFLAVLSVLFIRTRHVFRVELMGEEKTLSKALEKNKRPNTEKNNDGLTPGLSSGPDGLRIQHIGQRNHLRPCCRRNGYRAMAPHSAGAERPGGRLSL